MSPAGRSTGRAGQPFEDPDLAKAFQAIGQALEARHRDDADAPSYLDLLKLTTEVEPSWERFRVLLGYYAYRYERAPKTEIASAMGVGRKTLYRLWEEHGLGDDQSGAQQ